MNYKAEEKRFGKAAKKQHVNQRVRPEEINTGFQKYLCILQCLIHVEYVSQQLKFVQSREKSKAPG